MGKNPATIVGKELKNERMGVRGASAYKTRNSPSFRDAVKLHDVDEFGKAKPTIHFKRNKAGAPPPSTPHPTFFSPFPRPQHQKGARRMPRDWNV